MDLEDLFLSMVRMRRAEEISAAWWRNGLISGEYHSGVGEEGVAAGVVDHLDDRDALALDHRPTPAMLARGVDPKGILSELLGSPDGLCGGNGGHMHLADPDRRVVADGIVGASAPLACGFAFDAQLAGEGGVAVAFFGEGASNQGMLLESLNLSVVWRLPVVFVCKESGLAITTRRSRGTGADLVRRARGFGMPARRLPGWDVEQVWRGARKAIDRARATHGPSFLVIRVRRPEGHLLADPLLRIIDDPRGQVELLIPPLIDSLRHSSPARPIDRVRAVGSLALSSVTAVKERVVSRLDPLEVSRRRLGDERADPLVARARAEIDRARDLSLATMETGT